MASVNKTFLIGNLGKDPEIKFSNNGTQICKFSMATSEKYKKGDNYEEITTWHNIVLFGQSADYASTYLKKGNTIFIDGKISNRSWEENGVKKYISEVIGDKIQNLTAKNNEAPKQEAKTEEPSQDFPF